MSAAPALRAAPMAATREEILRGAGWAWLSFIVLGALALIITSIASDLATTAQRSPGAMSSLTMLPIVLMYALVIGGGISFVVMLVGLPITWLIARALRDVRSVAVHAAIYAGVGALIGIVAVIVFAQITNGDPVAMIWSGLAPVLVAITTLSVLFGWWRASRPARQALRAEGSTLAA